MRFRHLLLSAGAIAFMTACDSVLDVDPVEDVPVDEAIVDAVSARAALAGMYDAMQSGFYYGEVMYTFGDLSSDNASHTGTFTSYADADQNVLTSDNGNIDGMWEQMYDAINRANIIIEKIDGVPGLSQAEKDQMRAEALFVRALAHHDLLKYWGGVPIKTAPVTDLVAAANISRATVADVYTQILADLTAAEGLMTNTAGTRSASQGAVRALRARVLLYRASPGATGSNAADWAAVETAATAVVNMGYSLAPAYADLFTANGADTDEDIFRLRFNDQDANSVGYYYIVKSLGGRYEVGTTASIRNSYEAGDERRAYTIGVDPGNANRFYNAKYPTPLGTEHLHVIRYAEVLLIRAEARARQGNLVGAIADYNELRLRAGLTPHVLGVDVITQTDVLNAIARERRSELAFEGDRWADIVRSGTALAIMTAHRPSFPTSPTNYQILYPLPQSEIDVTRNTDGSARLTQNPGY